MQKLLLLLFTFFFCSAAQAQSTFEKVIDTLGIPTAKCVQQTFDGGFVVCATSSVGGNNVVVIKLDSTGTIEWAKTHYGSGNDIAQHIEQLPDSGYIVDVLYDGFLNSKNWLIRLDINGDTLWTQKLSVGVGATNAYQLATNYNGNYGLTGYFTSTTSSIDAYLIVTNDSGVPQTSKIFPTNYGSEGYGISRTFQNNFIVTGAKADSFNDNLYLFLTDSLGDTLWTKSYDNSQADIGNAVEQTSDGGFIVVGNTWNITFGKYNIYLIKAKSNGDTIWTKMFGGANEIGGNAVQQTKEGGYIVAGRIVNGIPLQADAYLLKTDSMGDTLWSRQYGGSSAQEASYVRQTKDGGYILCGSSSAINGGIYLIKTDSMGLVQSGTGIADINNPFGFNIYPNPCIGNFSINLKGINYKNSKVEIYNMYHQKIFSRPIKNINSTMEIDLRSEVSGIYLVVLKIGENVCSKKIIIDKPFGEK